MTRLLGFIFLFGAVFIISLWAGRWLGIETRQAVLAGWRNIEHSRSELKHAAHRGYETKNESQPVVDDSPTTRPAPNRQRNILLIGIDSLQAEEPRLEAVWMILYMQDLPHFMMVPVYPNRAPGDQNSPVLDQNLARLFQLEAGQTPSRSFLQALQNKELWWNGYLILDEAALGELIEISAGDNEGALQNQLPAVSDIPDIEQDPMRALLGQAHLAQELCRNSGLVLASDSSQFPNLIAKASTYIRTDLNLGEMVGEIKNALRYGGISCEFPSLATPTGQP